MRPVTPLALAFLALPLLAGCGSKRTPTGNGPAAYDVEVRFVGSAPSVAIQQAFTRAVARIEAVIGGGVDPIGTPGGFNLSECAEGFDGQPDLPAQTIDGLVIYVRVEPIDGVGSVLGSAGPCLVRDQDEFKPALGVMRLDEEDVEVLSEQRMDALILHEMLHVVGFGTVWTNNALLSGAGTADARFLGPVARDACSDLNGGVNTCAVDVPVHSADGIGSADAHWRESVFANELMTPFLNQGAAPLSAMSIGALADMGYTVRITEANPYLVNEAALRSAVVADGTPPLALPAPITPRYGIRPNRTLVPFGGAR